MMTKEHIRQDGVDVIILEGIVKQFCHLTIETEIDPCSLKKAVDTCYALEKADHL